MNVKKRYLFQIILWIGIWFILWLIESTANSFLLENLPILFSQLVLVTILLFYAAPRLLFNKKYVVFIIISMSIILVFSYLSSSLFVSQPTPKMPPPQHLNNLPPQKPPSRFFIHFILLSFTYILATSIELFFFAQQKEKENIKHKNENLQTELKLLKSQINPHFLFNALNNIYALSAFDTARTQASISYLSDMLRYVLYECEQALVPLSKEITYIDNYIKLFSLKSSKKFPITTDFQVFNDMKIAPMLLIPYVENALKHSNIESFKDSYIYIQIIAKDKNIQLKIENSVPKSLIQKDKNGGIGLENVAKRLAILYPNQHAIEIIKNETTFSVKLNIKLNGNY